MAYITDSWATIDKNCKLGKAQELYALGDLKTITFTVDGVTETIDMEIIGFEHDDLLDGSKATITFFSKQLLSQYKKMASSNRNTGGWAGSYSLRSWCNNTLYNALPEDLKALIRTVKKLSDGGNGSASLVKTEDKVWFASISEIAYDSAITTVGGQGGKYALVDQLGSSWRTKAKADGTTYHWWSRTSKTDSNQWGFTSQWGGYSYDNAANAFGVAFGFCVGKTMPYDEKYAVTSERLISFADTARKIVGSTATMTPSEMATAFGNVQELIDTANAKTGGSDTDLTSAVGTLVEGYGGIVLGENERIFRCTQTDSILTTQFTSSVVGTLEV